MMRSGMFVVWRWAQPKKEEDVDREYVVPLGTANAVDVGSVGKVSSRLSEATKFDRAGAFKYALGAGPDWRVGEIVSDKHGVRVED